MDQAWKERSCAWGLLNPLDPTSFPYWAAPQRDPESSNSVPTALHTHSTTAEMAPAYDSSQRRCGLRELNPRVYIIWNVHDASFERNSDTRL